MRFLLIGNGKMGKLIASTAQAAGDEIGAVFSRENLAEALKRIGHFVNKYRKN